MGKYKLTWRDVKFEDFKTYLFAMFKAFIPKKKIKNLDELEQFIQTNLFLFHHLKLDLEFLQLIFDVFFEQSSLFHEGEQHYFSLT